VRSKRAEDSFSICLLDWPGVVLGNSPLVRRQHIDPEAFSGVQMGMGSCAVVYAHQQQRWIERDGSECVGSHAMDLAIQVHGDDGHSRGKAPHRFSKFGWIEAHGSFEFFPAATAYISTVAARRDSMSVNALFSSNDPAV